MRRSIATLLLLVSLHAAGQNQKLYPPNTRWYQDPLGFRPVELSSAPGFVWGSMAVAACLVLTKKDEAFRKKIYAYNETGVGAGYKVPFTLMIQNNTGLLYRIKEWMSVGTEFTAFNFSDDTMKTTSFGLRPFARWYPVRTTGVDIFFEYGAGVSYSLNRFPSRGTKFNFTPKYSIGTEIKLSPSWLLQTGLRHSHLSNANIKGIPRNPSHDSNGLFVGLLYSIW